MTVVVDYGVGNLASVVNIGRKAGAALVVSSDPAVVAAAGKLILPGVGAFGRGMANLADRGLVPALHHAVVERKVPILGLCLGVHLFTRGSEEGGGPGLGWIAADSIRFQCDRDGSGLKVPHMGWNQLRFRTRCPLLRDLTDGAEVYFVHSFYVVPRNDELTATETDYPTPFTSMIWRDNVVATQFHPEKSQRVGLTMLRNFATW